jgi:hypothetical protein
VVTIHIALLANSLKRFPKIFAYLTDGESKELSPAISNLHLMVGVESGLELQMRYQLIRKKSRNKKLKRLSN